MNTSKGPGNGFNIVCAWCGRSESGEARPHEGPLPAKTPALPVSHTICDECFARERAEVERVIKARRKRTSA